MRLNRRLIVVVLILGLMTIGGVLFFLGLFNFGYGFTISTLCNVSKLPDSRCITEPDMISDAPLFNAAADVWIPEKMHNLYMHKVVYLGRTGDSFWVWSGNGLVRSFSIKEGETQLGLFLRYELGSGEEKKIQKLYDQGIAIKRESPLLETSAIAVGAGERGYISPDVFFRLLRPGDYLTVIYDKGTQVAFDVVAFSLRGI